jgi:hypothetical protein
MEQVTGEITIQVPQDVVDVYRQSSDEARQQLSEEIVGIVRLRRIDPSDVKLKPSMDRLAEAAQGNGLTDEILQEILQDDQDLRDEVLSLAGGSLEGRSLNPTKLKNALLDRIEQDNPKYQANVREALQEAMDSKCDREEMTIDEFGEWLTTL